MGEKHCDGCTLCCTLLFIPELGKPENTMCQHCTGESCEIYEYRPNSCRRFSCLWLRNESLLDVFRPDRCGVMFETYIQEKMIVAVCSSSDAWIGRVPLAMIKQMMRDGYIVWVIDRGTRHLMLPDMVTEKEAMEMARTAWKRKNDRS